LSCASSAYDYSVNSAGSKVHQSAADVGSKTASTTTSTTITGIYRIRLSRTTAATTANDQILNTINNRVLNNTQALLNIV
jgi:hypothetical protein